MIKLDDVLDRISTKEGLAYYGVVFNERNFTFCPFHREKTPSFHYNEKTDRYYCFSCGKGGNIVNFVAESFNYDLPKDLPKVLQKINNDFHLNLGQVPISAKERTAAAQEEKLNNEIKEAEGAWKEKLSREYALWTKVQQTLYQAFFHMEENGQTDQDLCDLLERLDNCLDDFTGNMVRELSPETFNNAQRNWIQRACQEQTLTANNPISFQQFQRELNHTASCEGTDRTITKELSME